MTDETIQAIVIAVTAALPPTLVALGALLQGRSNGRKVDKAATSADKAAEKADVAAARAEDVHAATQDIVQQSDKIAAQTNGHLSQLTDEMKKQVARNEELEKTVTTLVSILTASRVAEASADRKASITVPAVRTEDVTQTVQTLKSIVEKDANPHTE